MNNSAKQALLILVAGAILFIVFRPKENIDDKLFALPSSRKRMPIDIPSLSEEEMQDETLRVAYLALVEYIKAFNAGAKEAELEKIKEDYQEKLGLVIYQDDTLKLAVKDSAGNDILVNS